MPPSILGPKKMMAGEEYPGINKKHLRQPMAQCPRSLGIRSNLVERRWSIHEVEIPFLPIKK